jgi:hypothetical protein
LIDIDSLLRPVYGHAKQGASFGHTKISGRQVLRRGLSPLATTISTSDAAPVLAGIRLRAGKAGSGKGAASMVTEAINTARAAGASGEILVRGDSAYGISAVVAACLKARARFSLVLAKNPAVTCAIATIAADAWTPVHYPGAVVDPDTGELISDAEVAEVAFTAFTAFTSTNQPATARLVVRRVRDRAELDELFPVWRHHPFLTNSDESTVSTVEADLTVHRTTSVLQCVAHCISRQPWSMYSQLWAETVECAELVPVGVRALEVLGPVFRSGRELVVHRAEVGLLVRGDRSPHRDQEVAVAVRIGVTQREGSLQVGADEALAEDLGRP